METLGVWLPVDKGKSSDSRLQAEQLVLDMLGKIYAVLQTNTALQKEILAELRNQAAHEAHAEVRLGGTSIAVRLRP